MRGFENMIFIRKVSTVLGAVALLEGGAAHDKRGAPVGGANPHAPDMKQ